MDEQPSIKLTVEAWADIVIDIWLDKISKLGIGYYLLLSDSISKQLIGSNNIPSEVRFSFNYYGKFVDMGVGRGVKLEDVKTNQQEFRAGVGGSRRRAKKWYSQVFYSEVMKLSEILAQKYGRAGVLAIVENIDDNALKWTSPTV